MRLGAVAAGRAAPRRHYRDRRRAGFTLVEVIVVLVILAILAAIAIPALTGYIDKAQLKTFEAKVHTQEVALKTILGEQYAENGGFKPFTKTEVKPDDIFTSITQGVSIGGIYVDYLIFNGYTKAGVAEYEKLTGDTESYTIAPAQNQNATKRFSVITDLQGNICYYQYIVMDYLEKGVTLNVFYFENFDSPDPLTAGFKQALFDYAEGLKTMKDGFNFYVGKGQFNYIRLN